MTFTSNFLDIIKIPRPPGFISYPHHIINNTATNSPFITSQGKYFSGHSTIKMSFMNILIC